ncbi:MAG: M56 family metallopeptidase [Pseudomonadales bacterium]|nr:M56 family metallopeptidase [Pseudomonadales bacterium]
MDGVISQITHILFVVCAAILGVALLTAFFAPSLIRWIARYTPQDRLTLLELYAILPLAGGIFAGTMAALPTLSHALNIAVDHCHDSTACWWREAPHAVPPGQMLVMGLIAMSAVWAMLTAFRQWQRAHRLSSQLALGSCGAVGQNIKLIDSRRIIAFSTGLLKPFAVISTGLARRLTADQLAIVCLHEQLHTENRDNWHKWLFNVLSMFHWMGVRRSLLSEYALSLELRVDEQVARQVDNRIAVAETIVAVQRLTQGDQQSAACCYFAGSSTERRVLHLLNSKISSSLPRHLLATFIFCGIAAASSSALLFHDVFDALII